MVILAESLARPSWLSSLFLGRVMAGFYSAYSTGFLWNVFGIKALITLAIGLGLLYETRRRDSWTAAAFDRLSRRLARGPLSGAAGRE